MFRLAINSIISHIMSWFSILPSQMLGAVYVYSWIHDPNYSVYLDTVIPITDLIYARDVQPDVLIYRNDKGAVLGYDDGSGHILLTGMMGHVTLEGTIIIWGEDADIDGMFCVIFPYNTEIGHITSDTYNLSVLPIPTTAQTFGNPIVKWRYTDRPNYWFTDNPRVSITVVYDITASHLPYVATTYWAQNTTRYDYKNLLPEYHSNGSEIYKPSLPSITLNAGELKSQIDLCAWLIGILKRKYTQETGTLDNFRKKTYNV